MNIKFKYLPDKNRAGVFFEGVPLADITEERFARFRPEVQAQIRESGFYKEVVTVAPPRETPKKEGE